MAKAKTEVLSEREQDELDTTIYDVPVKLLKAEQYQNRHKLEYQELCVKENILLEKLKNKKFEFLDDTLLLQIKGNKLKHKEAIDNWQHIINAINSNDGIRKSYLRFIQSEILNSKQYAS